jgi:integrase
MSLTVKRVARLMRRGEAGQYTDGGTEGVRGLRLIVANKHAAHFELRFQLDHRSRQMGLGSARDISLAEAREKAKTARKLLLEKIDPLEARRVEYSARLAVTASRMTFKEAATAYIAAHQSSWKSAEHGRQWLSSLASYVHPLIGSLDVAQIDKPLVLRVLRQPVAAALGKPAGQFWTVRTVTADRVRNRIELVLGFATAEGRRPSGPNPASWDELKHVLASPKKVVAVTHHAAVAYNEIPALIANLRGREGVGASALQFVILTACRVGEALGATWEEIDFNTNTWTIPKERMKASKEHKVPLAPYVVDLLNDLQREDANEHLFIGPRNSVLSNDALTAVLRRLDRTETVHGFRSSFSDWANEQSRHPRAAIEIALAHKVGNEVEQAYRRGDMILKRKQLMIDWSVFCTTPIPTGATVTPLHRAR